jgi:peptidoglycan/xylan/chitin deacetylase (PgdA/CDA1 family)
MDPTMLQAVAGAGLTCAGVSAYFSPWIWRYYQMNPVRKSVANCRQLVLTYDDGPTDAVTPKLLDMLGTRGVRATFFMLGRHARECPQIADRIIREGHDVGCHSYSHVNAWKSNPWDAIADINAGYNHLSSWIPANGMFRPPHGKMTLPTYWALRRRGAPVWWWTLDSGDTNDTIPSPGSVVDKLRNQGGGIILLHDADRGWERNNFVLEVTDILLDVAKRESFNVIPLRELHK